MRGTKLTSNDHEIDVEKWFNIIVVVIGAFIALALFGFTFAAYALAGLTCIAAAGRALTLFNVYNDTFEQKQPLRTHMVAIGLILGLIQAYTLHQHGFYIVVGISIANLMSQFAILLTTRKGD